jgi:NTP pyrophosphatase (non-canonical NTP hydrolase)
MTPLQFYQITEWQKQTFGSATALSKIAHLLEECNELISDLEKDSPDKRLEFADCFILLFGAAAADGMDFEDICKAIHDKMEINYKRKWGKPKENGVINHIKTENHE